MSGLEFIAIAVSYLACSVLAYAGSYADWQREYPEIAEEQRSKDRSRSFLYAVFGPLGFIVVAISTLLLRGRAFKNGFML